MYQEFDFLMYMPKDLAILALDGNRDYLGKEFNLADLNLKQKCFLFYFGYHRNITENLNVGARVKIYSSIFNATSTNNNGYVLTEDGTTTSMNRLWIQTCSLTPLGFLITEIRILMWIR
jgi:hypothetical protein